MELEIKELTNVDEVLKAYDIYKHCMYMPTTEKYEKKILSFLQNENIKIFSCFVDNYLKGISVISFFERYKSEVLGIAVDSSARNQGIGSYMVTALKNTFNLDLIYAETDDDAVVFYKKNGFNITEFTNNYDGQIVTRYKCELKN